jgi:ApbE superfamily uncharacterized protein (UPF0280 family)
MGARFRSFSASYEETDLWIGVDPDSYALPIDDFAVSMARRLRLELDAYIASRPEFLASLAPIADDPLAPSIARAMLAASAGAGVGPMAAVAGAIAETVGSRLAAEFGCRETIVENGGDLWLLFREPVDASVFAGDSPLSERVGISIPRELSPIGLCTSSGTVGPSLSLGRADAAMVACRSAAAADAWATKIGNAVGRAEDIEGALDLVAGRADILSVVLIKGDVMGIRGELPLKIFGSRGLDPFSATP